MKSQGQFVKYGPWLAGAVLSGGLLLAWGRAPSAEPAREGGSGTATGPAAAAQSYSPPVRFANTDTNLYWGDTHLHTNNSVDAFVLGATSIDPDDAFRFAMGQEVVAESGAMAKLRRPLDFLVVADHAEYLGVLPRLARGDGAKLDWEQGKRWAGLLKSGDVATVMSEFIASIQGRAGPSTIPPEFTRSIWQDVANTAERYNQPGRFTAFIGYEWSSAPSSDNLHRNVIFRDGVDKTTKIVPFSAADSSDPEKLWASLREYETKTGGEVLAIPHNGNLSNGRMFAPQTFTGQPFTASYARERARWEPLIEVTQSKGTGEAHPSLSPTDEFADFELWDKHNLGSTEKKPWMLPYEYARSALKEGLGYEQRLGTNPFKFGMIGSTDSHNGLASTTEDNYFGKFAGSEPSPDRYREKYSSIVYRDLSASGLAAVWARENTREAIFDAFKRREVYATTGSRIQLRFFGGWSFAKSDVLRPDYARVGYDKGVPMGGDLIGQTGTGAPRFMIVAAKDPDEANLDRIQVIKGWLDAQGQAHEKIYDVALSDGRKVNPRTGKAPPVGSTVDVPNAIYTNGIGDPELAAVWTDPDFRPDQRAFYYVRVLEIPKPRWSAYDAKFFKVKMPADIPMTVQDRAYSSPIWYNPLRVSG